MRHRSERKKVLETDKPLYERCFLVGNSLKFKHCQAQKDSVQEKWKALLCVTLTYRYGTKQDVLYKVTNTQYVSGMKGRNLHIPEKMTEMAS